MKTTDNIKSIVLSKPNLKRGKCIMETISQRQSTREFSSTEVTLGDLSDLLWAANGINREEDGRRTTPSAMNLQEIAIYAFMEKGVYKYDFENHILELVKEGDHRKLVAGKQEDMASTPLFLVYIGDVGKLEMFGERKVAIASIDAGIVSQNVNLFCASVGISTVPRINMEVENIIVLLGLTEDNIPLMNNAIGYSK